MELPLKQSPEEPGRPRRPRQVWRNESGRTCSLWVTTSPGSSLAPQLTLGATAALGGAAVQEAGRVAKGSLASKEPTEEAKEAAAGKQLLLVVAWVVAETGGFPLIVAFSAAWIAPGAQGDRKDRLSTKHERAGGGSAQAATTAIDST